MVKKATKAAGAKVGKAVLAGLMGGGLIASPQARLNEMRPTPFVPPKTTRKQKGK